MLGADAKVAERAAHLCKADLLTGIVGEFPKLQGVMGRHYALLSGEDPRVADAIAGALSAPLCRGHASGVARRRLRRDRRPDRYHYRLFFRRARAERIGRPLRASQAVRRHPEPCCSTGTSGCPCPRSSPGHARGYGLEKRGCAAGASRKRSIFCVSALRAC